MIISRVLSQSIKSGSTKLSQRGFAVSASQQIVNNQQQNNINDSSSRMHGVLAADVLLREIRLLSLQLSILDNLAR